MSSEDEVMAAAPPPESIAWGSSPSLYLSYGMVSLKGRRPSLTDAVAAEQSFTALSPPMALDYFAVFDGHSGAARLGTAIAERIEGELRSDTPRFGASHDVAGWWRTVIREAFRAFDEEVVASSGAAAGEDAFVGATALVALVMESYIVLANSGTSRAVLSRGGEDVQLTSEHKVPNSTPDEKLKQSVENDGGSSVYKQPCKMAEPAVTAVERKPEDEFLILASDGLWDAVTPASACAFVRQRLLNRRPIRMPWEAPRLDARGSPTLLAKELAECALRAGSQDNVSVVVVLFRDFWTRS